MEALLHDLRFAVRILWRSAGTTLAIIAALALGIGANSAMYTIVDASVFHAVTYASPEQLSLLWERDAQGSRHGASAANFLDWRTRSQSFSELAARASATYVLTGDRPQQVAGSAVTANFFHTLGVKPLLGRTFLG